MNMFPFYRAGNGNDSSKKEKLLSEQICPLGCLCCIMQQFYDRKCWCKEVKESIGVQTDFPRDECVSSEDVPSHKHTTKMVTTSTQTDDGVTLYPDDLQTSAVDLTEKEQGMSRTQKALPTLYDVKGGISPQRLSEHLKQRNQRRNSSHVSACSETSLGNSSPEPDAHSPVPNTRTTPDVIALQKTTANSIKAMPTPLAIPNLRGNQNSKVFQNSSTPIMSTSSTYCPGSPLHRASTVYKDIFSDKPEKGEPSNAQTQNYFVNATTEYTLMQNAIGNIVDKYELTGAKDPNFETALEELFEEFPNIIDTPVTRKTVRDKLRHKISSRRHYDRIRNEADAIGIGVSVLKRRKMHENAIQNKLIGETMLKNSLTQLAHSSYLPNQESHINIGSSPPLMKVEQWDGEDSSASDSARETTANDTPRREEGYRIKIEPLDTDDF